MRRSRNVGEGVSPTSHTMASLTPAPCKVDRHSSMPGAGSRSARSPTIRNASIRSARIAGVTGTPSRSTMKSVASAGVY